MGFLNSFRCLVNFSLCFFPSLFELDYLVLKSKLLLEYIYANGFISGDHLCKCFLSTFVQFLDLFGDTFQLTLELLDGIF